ncbi:hypothetical protein GOV09_03525 [Candidatus Woesearchaeota archaeon]|nr:hypothetical protein [Candidatus Woesearchaeota archaeon]
MLEVFQRPRRRAQGGTPQKSEFPKAKRDNNMVSVCFEIFAKNLVKSVGFAFVGKAYKPLSIAQSSLKPTIRGITW